MPMIRCGYDDRIHRCVVEQTANPGDKTLLILDYNADADANGEYILCRDNAYADTKFKVDVDGNTTVAGTLGVTGAATLTGGFDANAASTAREGRGSVTIPFPMVFATALPWNSAPAMAQTARMMTAVRYRTRPAPTQVPTQLAASLAPMLAPT